jgi:hypothetical protein
VARLDDPDILALAEVCTDDGRLGVWMRAQGLVVSSILLALLLAEVWSVRFIASAVVAEEHGAG